MVGFAGSRGSAHSNVLPSWGVTVVPPVDEGEGPRLAASVALFDAIRPTFVADDPARREPGAASSTGREGPFLPDERATPVCRDYRCGCAPWCP
jgi:hypothetical protein